MLGKTEFCCLQTRQRVNMVLNWIFILRPAYRLLLLHNSETIQVGDLSVSKTLPGNGDRNPAIFNI